MKRTALALALVSLAGLPALRAADPRPVITLPVRVHLLQSVTQTNLHTTLTAADVKRIFGKVNMIWSPAGIQFEVESIGKSDALPLPPRNDAARQYERIRDTVPKDRLSPLAIDVAYIKSIADNGFYYGEPAIVKDTAKLTDVPGGIDEPIPRVTAHELGHSLGLKHRQNVTNLMASKMSGYSLNVEEIETARTKARAWQAKFDAEKKSGR